MTLYTWRASYRGWREPNWRIAVFWLPLLALASGAIFLIAWLAAPLPRWSTFLVGIPLGIGALHGGAWLAGATREPDFVDRIEAGETPITDEFLERLVSAVIEEPAGSPARRRPCWRCRTYRRWLRDRRHHTCAKAVTVEYEWLDQDRARQLHDAQHATNVHGCPYCAREQSDRGKW